MVKRYFIAMDFDGTLCENKFPEIGNIRADVMTRLQARRAELQTENKELTVILWTCREDNGIQIDAVNDNPWVSFGGGRKIFAHEYWDDRAVVC